MGSSLKNMFNTIKRGMGDTIILADLDKFLSIRDGNDRRFDINSPSCIGRCMRSNYYGRVLKNTNVYIDPKLRRIFENGDGVHERLQYYFECMGRMMMSEVPLINDEYKIQGHSDGLITYDLGDKIAVLELKSINDKGFRDLREPKPEHTEQGLTYLYCLEERRKFLRKTYPTRKSFDRGLNERREWYRDHYKHLKDGSKYTREQKITKKAKDHEITDDILYDLDFPITLVVFLYENKNTQEIKEFVVKYNESKMESILNYYQKLNRAVTLRKVPAREGTSKMCYMCTNCDWVHDCWN